MSNSVNGNSSWTRVVPPVEVNSAVSVTYKASGVVVPTATGDYAVLLGSGAAVTLPSNARVGDVQLTGSGLASGGSATLQAKLSSAAAGGGGSQTNLNAAGVAFGTVNGGVRETPVAAGALVGLLGRPFLILTVAGAAVTAGSLSVEVTYTLA